ncbi:MAG TPA: fibronectin type III-like domain-contianing protein, partial [Longimicrobiaceae bacterium]|nr:fibronectin type III-like domain-contianing protein [Longimicrobiaceae bacterium]
LYVKHLGSKVSRPREELKGFRRISLQPGETKTVRLALPASELAYWDEGRKGWVVEREPVQLRVGASSADIRLEKTVQVE